MSRAEPLQYAAFDLETTGFSSTNDRIVEIGVVVFTTDDVLLATNWLINPCMPMPPIAQRIHGISDKMLEQQPLFNAVYPLLTNTLNNTVNLAHNAPFDLRFLHAECKRNGLSPPAFKTLDTLPLFRQWFTNAPRHSMEGLKDFFEIDAATLHRALEDADCLRKILLIGLDEGHTLPPPQSAESRQF